MIYLDYETYKKMGGELNEGDFTRFSFLAQNKIDVCTFNRITESIYNKNKVKIQFLMFSLIGLYQKSDGVQVASESNNGVSRSYKNVEYGKVIDDLCSSILSQLENDGGLRLDYLGIRYTS